MWAQRRPLCHQIGESISTATASLCPSLGAVAQAEVEIRRAWRHIAGTGRDGTVDALLMRYGEPHRHYHTVTHLMMVLRNVHDIAAMSGCAPSPELVAAALYHDAIYDPRADDNELHSAALASRDLADLGWVEVRCAAARSLIMATAGHVNAELAGGGGGPGLQTAIMLDADLAILGAEPLRYQAYANLVRAEYFFVDDRQWRTGRSRVLQTFLARPRIFTTQYMHDQYDHRARANIEAELATLAPVDGPG
jgi:predicted metal-dependent HD superfamily phosphohydrolase